MAKTPPVNEVHARHILVKTKEEAEAIIKQLDGGAKFEDIAKEKSSDGSAAQGGDLGWFGTGQMVPEFETAASRNPMGKPIDLDNLMSAAEFLLANTALTGETIHVDNGQRLTSRPRDVMFEMREDKK